MATRIMLEVAVDIHVEEVIAEVRAQNLSFRPDDLRTAIYDLVEHRLSAGPKHVNVLDGDRLIRAVQRHIRRRKS